MKTVQIIALLLTCLTTYGQAQHQSTTSKQARTIEISNGNGDLSITFEEDIITEFTINGKPVDTDKYENYQDVVDQFSNDGTQPIASSPTPPSTENQENEKLYATLIAYLMDEGIINSTTHYKIELKRKSMKVDGNTISHQMHMECLRFFQDIYGHPLNSDSKIKIKKAGNSLHSSIHIVE